MPVNRIIPDLQDNSELVDELVHVLHENKPTGPPDDPEIIIEEVQHSKSLHVTVIWDRWEEIDAEERGRIILEAVAKELGEAEMLRVTMALGVTKKEAYRLNIRDTYDRHERR